MSDFLDTFDPELRKAYEFAHEHVDPKLVDYSKIKMHKDSIKLSGDGTFYTLQGEGPTIGLPCVFVRLHVCNLRCTWCDAWYTWNPNTKEYWTEPRDVGFDTLAQQIRDTWGGEGFYVPKRVIWSGGEPLIQKNQIDAVMKELAKSNDPDDLWVAEVETNGTLMPTNQQLMDFQFNCSPKLANSENQHFSMVKPKVLKALNEANTTFKFVCRDQSDLDEVFDKYVAPGYISEHKITIMPEGITEAEITPHARALYEPCMKLGWRMTPRFQAIFADGARRGV